MKHSHLLLPTVNKEILLLKLKDGVFDKITNTHDLPKRLPQSVKLYNCYFSSLYSLLLLIYLTFDIVS